MTDHTSSSSDDERITGRRERNKADKRQRIENAANELFAEHGYPSVTTQEVARRAGVGTGTLFRYAKSKGELLCLVANEMFRDAVEVEPDTGNVVDDIVSLCQPFIRTLAIQPANTVAYHRETIFGDPGPHRDEALRILARLRATLATILARETGREAGDSDVRGAAYTVFDVIYMEIVRAGVYKRPDADFESYFRDHVERALYGCIGMLSRDQS